MKHLYGKNRPAQAGIPVAETGIPPRRGGTKNVPPPYKQYAIKTIETYTCRDPGHRPVPINVPSRLSYKQALIQYIKPACMTDGLPPVADTILILHVNTSDLMIHLT